LEKNTFVAYLLGKKNSGKGTYSKLFAEAVGVDIGHVAVGDIVRDVHKSLENPKAKQELVNFLKKNYRGFHSIDETVSLIEGRDQSSLISSELILALLEYEISRRPRQALFIDGFPRAHDQIGYSLYLKKLIGYREDPDFFVFINLPNSVIDERIKFRVICPVCKAPRNLKLFATKQVGFDKETQKFYLICDNANCPEVGKARMVPKEGDELGIEPIKKRLEVDDQIFKKLLTLHGIPKVYLRNSLPAAVGKEFVDDYEVTPVYNYELQSDGSVKTIESPWVIKDDEGVDSLSLLPPPVVVAFLKQVAEVLEL
jgi:adenylate kinase family enzyme